jgi:hypothetical protein
MRLADACSITHSEGMAKRPKRPRDMNQLGKAIVDLATGNAPPEPDRDKGKNPAAVALGRLCRSARRSSTPTRKASSRMGKILSRSLALEVRGTCDWSLCPFSAG